VIEIKKVVLEKIKKLALALELEEMMIKTKTAIEMTEIATLEIKKAKDLLLVEKERTLKEVMGKEKKDVVEAIL